MNIVFVNHDGTMNTGALSQHYGVEVTLVEADLGLGEGAIKSLKDALWDKDIGILVNCVSRSLALPSQLTEMSEQGLLELMNRSVVATTLMTRLVLPRMVQRRCGAVVHLCSGAGGRSSTGRAALVASEVSSPHEHQSHHSPQSASSYVL